MSLSPSHYRQIPINDEDSEEELPLNLSEEDAHDLRGGMYEYSRSHIDSRSYSHSVSSPPDIAIDYEYHSHDQHGKSLSPRSMINSPQNDNDTITSMGHHNGDSYDSDEEDLGKYSFDFNQTVGRSGGHFHLIKYNIKDFTCGSFKSNFKMQFQNAVSNAHNHFQFLIESIAHMTNSKDYEVPVRAWLNTDDNMTEECSGQERQGIKNELTTIDRREKDNQFKHLDEDARFDKYRTEIQIERLLQKLLLANRNGIFKPEYTNHGLERALVGEESSCQGERLKASNATLNAYWNPINNPIAVARKKEELRAAHALVLANTIYDDEKYNGILVATTKADSIVLDFHCFQLIVSVQASYNLPAFEGCTISFYIFFTSRDASINGVEWAAFLSSRSGFYWDSEGVRQHTPGRPVLRHTEESPLYRHNIESDGSIITPKQMKDELGFKVETLFTSKFMINARDVEDALQRKFQHLPLGCRLWRRPDAGAKFAIPDGKVHSVGIVYSDQILPLIEQGMIEVCH